MFYCISCLIKMSDYSNVSIFALVLYILKARQCNDIPELDQIEENKTEYIFSHCNFALYRNYYYVIHAHFLLNRFCSKTSIMWLVTAINFNHDIKYTNGDEWHKNEEWLEHAFLKYIFAKLMSYSAFLLSSKVTQC